MKARGQLQQLQHEILSRAGSEGTLMKARGQLQQLQHEILSRTGSGGTLAGGR